MSTDTLAGTAVADGPGKTVTYRIPDVAAMTHISARRIVDACRSGDIDHIHAGGRRVMTQAQIDAMLAFFSTGAKPKAAPINSREQARQSSLRAASRSTPRRTA
ncbi:helix-turn-helix domain-containing protein [Micromonosporaceae bacterium Da 78-11]